MPNVTSPRTVVITGASSGIGRAIAAALAAPAMRAHLLGRSRERLEEVVRHLRQAGAEAHPHEIDLLDDAKVRALAEALAAEAGGIDVLVHSAGDVALGRVESAPIADLDRQYRINVRLPFLLTQCLLPSLRKARGQVVFVNSGAGLNARPEWGQYAITKHGLKALADSLREEVKPLGVRVLSVFPGRTATPMQEAVHRLEGKDYRAERFLQPADVASQVHAALDLPDTAAVTDLILRPARA